MSDEGVTDEEVRELSPIDHDDPELGLHDDEIVGLLKSEDGNQRAKALEALYPGLTVSMVTVHKTGQLGMASTRNSNYFQLFTALCWAAGFVGQQLGMALQWGPKPGGPDNKKIVIARPGHTPMMK